METQTRQWSYSQDPSTSDLDWVRFKIGDTNPGEKFLFDAEIEALIVEYPDRIVAAAHAAFAYLSILTRMVTESIRKGDETVSVTYSARVKNYKEFIFDPLNDMAGDILISSVVPGDVYVGGISRQDKEIFRDDTDLLRTSFRRGMFKEHPNDDRDDELTDCCD